jgi:hypothetical protein
VSQAPQLVGCSVGTTVRRSPYWLLAKRRRGKLEIFTTSLADDRRVLPVFSFEEEAALFLWLSVQGSWQVRRTAPAELVSLLYGPCREVELVALDPMSEVETDVMNRLVSVERGRFVDVLLHRPSDDAPLGRIGPDRIVRRRQTPY